MSFSILTNSICNIQETLKAKLLEIQCFSENNSGHISNIESYNYYQGYCLNFEKIFKIKHKEFCAKFYESADNFQSEHKEYAILLSVGPSNIRENLNIFNLLILLLSTNLPVSERKFKKSILHIIGLCRKLQKHIEATSVVGKIEILFKIRLSSTESKVCMDWFNLNLMQKCSLSIYHNKSYYYNFQIDGLSDSNKFVTTYNKKLHIGDTSYMEFKQAFIDFDNQFYLLQCP